MSQYVPLERLRILATEKGLQATFTLAAGAREFRETQALERMSPEQRNSYQAGWKADDTPE